MLNGVGTSTLYVVRYSQVIYEDDEETTYRTVRKTQSFRSLRAAAEFAQQLEAERDLEFDGIRRHEYERLTEAELAEFEAGRRG